VGQVVSVGPVLPGDPHVEHDPKLEPDDRKRFDEHHDFNHDDIVDFDILDFDIHVKLDVVEPDLANDDEDEHAHAQKQDAIVHFDDPVVHLHVVVNLEYPHRQLDDDNARGQPGRAGEPAPWSVFVCVAGGGADWGAEFLY
jgi:hypothetical protein